MIRKCYWHLANGLSGSSKRKWWLLVGLGSYFKALSFTCCWNSRLHFRVGAAKDLANDMHVLRPFQNGSSTGSGMGKHFLVSNDAGGKRDYHEWVCMPQMESKRKCNGRQYLEKIRLDCSNSPNALECGWCRGRWTKYIKSKCPNVISRLFSTHDKSPPPKPVMLPGPFAWPGRCVRCSAGSPRRSWWCSRVAPRASQRPTHCPECGHSLLESWSVGLKRKNDDIMASKTKF